MEKLQQSDILLPECHTTWSFQVPESVKNKMLDDHTESSKKAINRLCVSSLGITSQQQKLLYMFCGQQHMAIHSVAGIKQQTFPSAEPVARDGCRAAPTSSTAPPTVPTQFHCPKHCVFRPGTCFYGDI